MAEVYGYTRIASDTAIKRLHKVPEGSTLRVTSGQVVKAGDPLAVADVAREHRLIDLVEALRIKPRQIAACLRKQEGDDIAEGEVLAERRGLLGMGGRQVIAPFDGRIVLIESGQMLLEGRRTRLEVEATLPGRVVRVEPEELVMIETSGGLVQMAWGSGGLAWGTLRVMDDTPGLVTGAGRFNIDHRGMIVAIGSPLTAEFLAGAVNIRVKGVIAASMPASLLPLLDEIEFTIGLTQGFGQVAMSERILSLLKAFNGRDIVLDTPKRADWRERRPEIIIPSTAQQAKPSVGEQTTDLAYRVGQKVWIRQAPYLGEIGTIAEVPGSPHQLASGLWASGAMVDTPSGERVFVPFANLEYLG